MTDDERICLEEAIGGTLTAMPDGGAAAGLLVRVIAMDRRKAAVASLLRRDWIGIGTPEEGSNASSMFATEAGRRAFESQ